MSPLLVNDSKIDDKIYFPSPVVYAHVRPLHGNKIMPKKTASIYTLKIKEIFKGPPFLKSSLQANVNLTTPPTFGSCTVKLQSGDYVISGRISNGNLYSGFCNFQKKWALTTLNQRLGMRGEYNKDAAARWVFV